MSALWNDIQLDRHGVIEAHAGTGKTYTIVQLVLRILETPLTDSDGKSRFVHIREILLVTFTEKAAGELKKRIREGLEARIALLSEAEPLHNHLESCLNNLHEAFFGTIHAVCLRLLQSWPFESGIPFDTEIVDDSEGLGSALRESMRTDWQDTATAIPWAVDRIAISGNRLTQSHFELIIALAGDLLDNENVLLDRSILQQKTLRDLKNEYSKLYEETNSLWPDFSKTMLSLILALKKAKESGCIEVDRVMLLDRRVAEFQQIQQADDIDLRILKNPCTVGKKSIYTKAHLKKNPSLANVEECSAALSEHPLAAALIEKTTIEERIPLALTADASELLAHRWKRTKESSGLISYQGMLQLMLNAVRGSPSFSHSLRKRLHYAIIDEFQDTSRLQWNIFEHLFLQSDTPESTRFFVVGDPKQSIYLFQGADIQSYLDARALIRARGGLVYHLSNNYRSYAETIRGCNAIFASDKSDIDWFLFEDDHSGISYRTDDASQSVLRSSPPQYPLPFPPVQVMALEGSKELRIKQMADQTCQAIRKLVGTRVSVPDGLAWKEHILDYGDFAVIVESHNLADPFLALFRSERLPALKYKMEGVFQSSMAHALHTVLRVIVFPAGNSASRLAALLTPFFNRRPEDIDPEKDLEPCKNPQCSGNTLCIAHALEEWTSLAARSQWAQLFQSIQDRTGSIKRLMQLADGERHCADLRQIIDYCMELLYIKRYTLIRLTEHLGNLLDRKEQAGQDRNLHVLATQKSSIKILTIHAAKGLEFPVVFVITSGSRPLRNGPSYSKWTTIKIDNESETGRMYVTPYLRKSDIVSLQPSPLTCMTQERRRLLYVALTRSQLLLFIPMHFQKIERSDGKTITWSTCKTPSKSVDNDLTPRLALLLDAPLNNTPVALFDLQKFPHPSDTTYTANHPSTVPSIEESPDISTLKLNSRICRQTSYSQLSHNLPSARSIDRSEEVEGKTGDAVTERPSPLPGGRQTGDALHCALEELLLLDDIQQILSDRNKLENTIVKYLQRNGVILHGSPDNVIRNDKDSSAISAAVNCIYGALTTAIELPGGTILEGIVSLDRSDRHPEMEFLFNIEQHWVHGFMDLVFRIKNPDTSDHSWKYYILDWKSDVLAQFDEPTISETITTRHYDLQAKLYCHALDRFLRSTLGKNYSAEKHLGGAVYLFLREHERSPQNRATVWIHTAHSKTDKKFVLERIR